MNSLHAVRLCWLIQQLCVVIVACDVDQYSCVGGWRCILQQFVCDGNNDCGDFSDESNCSKLFIWVDLESNDIGQFIS